MLPRYHGGWVISMYVNNEIPCYRHLVLEQVR